MQIAFFTLGCKVNQYETNVIMEQFVMDGFEVVEPEEYADIYVINSCTVTSGSDKKTRQMLRRFRRQNPSAIIALSGCFPQAFPNIAEEILEADILMGSTNRHKTLSAVKAFMVNREKIIDIEAHQKGKAFEKMKISSFGSKTRAFVKIQDGCECFCSYCIIPYARGPVRSKLLADLKLELEALAEKGYKEIVLVGINLSSYGKDLGLRLLDAVTLACGINGILRVRLGSLEPDLLSTEDITYMASLDKLCPQFHLSLQSGSDSVLKRMTRPYSTDDYRRIVKDIRNAFGNSAITTDIMVGFPGETSAEHEESLAFVEEIGFARAHVFAYSRRPSTPADEMPNQLTAAQKASRSDEMIKLTDSLKAKFLESQVGLVEDVLFENSHTLGVAHGYSKNYTPITVKSSDTMAKELKQIKIVGYNNDSCVGDLIAIPTT